MKCCTVFALSNLNYLPLLFYIQTLRQSSSRLENRTHLVTQYRMGPKVFINCAGFIKIDTNSISDRYVHFFQSFIEIMPFNSSLASDDILVSDYRKTIGHLNGNLLIFYRHIACSNHFLAFCDFCPLLITFSISLNPDQDTNRMSRSGSKPFDTLIVSLNEFFEKVIFEKSADGIKRMKNYPACKEI